MKRFGWIVAAVTLGLLAVGCGGSGSPEDRLPDPNVRFVNSVVSTQNLDFFLNTDRAAPNLPYTTATPDFQRIDFIRESDDAYDITITPAGDVEELDRLATSFAKDTNTLILAYGLLNYGADLEKRPQVLLVQTPRVRPIGDKSLVMVVNALARPTGVENEAINFQSVDPSDPNSEDNPQFRKSNIGFGTYSADANDLLIDSGTRTFQARQAGSDAIEVYASREFTFEPGRVYLALVTGQVENTTAGLAPQIVFIEISTLR